MKIVEKNIPSEILDEEGNVVEKIVVTTYIITPSVGKALKNKITGQVTYGELYLGTLYKPEDIEEIDKK